MSTVIASRGIAHIQIRAGEALVGGTYKSASVLLNVSEKNVRSGSVAFWQNQQIHDGKIDSDRFQGQEWSLFGTGLMVRKQRDTHHFNEDQPYGVLALWPLVSESADTFARLGEINALASVKLETGCQMFGIFRSIYDPTVFSLIEVFNQLTDFNLHLETKHFLEFAEYARPRYLGDRSQTLKGTVVWL